MDKKIKIVFAASDKAPSGKIWEHVFKDPQHECGGFLIGSMIKSPFDKEEVIFQIDDVYFDDKRKGSTGEFVFDSKYGMDAYNYLTRNYKVDGELTKKIIGNYHSHGQFGAFFSDTDMGMAGRGTAPELYLVYSPAQTTYTAVYKDEDMRLHNEVSANNFCAPGASFEHVPANFTQEQKTRFVKAREK